MLGFRLLQQRAVAGALLTDLAEQGIWLPESGFGRIAVRVLVERSQQWVDGQLLATEDEELNVTVWRDPCNAMFDEVDLGGVPEPRIGDRLLRDPTRDTDRPYHFGGEIVAETVYTWRLRLKRKRVVQAGTQGLAR